MSTKKTARKHRLDGQFGIWALEMVYPHPPKRQGNVARGSGTMSTQPDGTICIEGNDVGLIDQWGRPFYLRLRMRVYEGMDEMVENDPHLIGVLAG